MSAVLPVAPPSRFEPALQVCLAGCLGALGFFVSWSTAGTSVALLALLLVGLAMPLRTWRAVPWREPLVVIGLALLAYIALRSIGSGRWDVESVKAANRYHELLMIPLVWALMRLCGRRNAFLVGLLVGSLALALAHWLPLPPGPALKLELRRISAGFGLSVCAFIFYEEARLGRLRPIIGYCAAAFLATTVLIASGARTGYVVLLVLVVCAAWRTAPARWRWPVLLSLVVAAVAAASLISTVRERRGDIAVSNKIRTEFLHNSLEVVRGHWLVGTGWVAYAQAYEEVAARRGAPADALWARSENPHNEYLLQAAAGGLPALALFVAWLAWPIAAPLRRRRAVHPQAGVLACIALAFAVGCIFNSMLLDFIEGHLYATLLAWLMAQRE